MLLVLAMVGTVEYAMRSDAMTFMYLVDVTKIILTYFLRGSITVWLTSCLTGLDLNKRVNMLIIQHKQSN